ncbi:glycosyltransferase family 39 protein [Polyangium sp. 6x1]|uniref:glycosyltransferase family 39 protein n=1 Tax=Polyangium sp. 6x1 TaxID=3042689 RepID=UPI0024827099|nr:glycosyltransferase family 39 protein [Polyangium sp. 6x1]MDI1451154.1 glycosyltransferase family 39 protein [Polyangium sp. 6x1]
MPALLQRRDLGLVALVKVIAVAIVVATGFRAVSDDDFARVVIAQDFAHTPKLDPTGTSWLPFPFWITGAAMLGAGRTLLVARVTAFVLGVLSAVLVALAAERLTKNRTAALLGAVLAAVFPWSARLGVATVPELPTAALALFAMASLVGPREPRARLFGGLALLGATLSRYDVWPIAAAFAALTGLDALRDRDRSGKDRALFILAAALALLGPLLWVLWNHFARGNAFDSLDRVAAYRRALGGEADAPLARLFAYPLAMARHEPELFGALAVLLALAALPSLRASAREALRPYARPLALALFQLVALSAALIKDGAPTHHPERALLVGLLLCALVAGDLAATLLPRASRKTRLGAGAAALALLVFSLVIVRRWFRGEDFVPRTDEVAIGEAARALVPPGERVLVEVRDYGHFAITAALGRPEDVVLDRDLDPRKAATASTFDAPLGLSRRLTEARARFLLGRTASPAAAVLGPPRAVHGSFGLWEHGSP